MLRAALAASFLSVAAQQPGASVQPPPGVEQRPAPPPANALTIEQAIQIALDRNYDLRRSEYQAATAEQNLVLARSIILPQLGFNGSVTKIRQGAGTQVISGLPFVRATDIFTQYVGNVVLRQLVFDGGNCWNNL